jgi:TP901 family phage tail tape measure protein
MEILISVADQASGPLRSIMQGVDDIQGAGRRLQDVGGALFGVGAGIAAVSAPFVLAGVDAVRTAADVEEATANFSKASNIAGEELDEMRDKFMALSREIPLTAVELLTIGTELSKMGIAGEESILQTTELVSQMSTAFDISAEDAGTAVGKLAASFGMIEDGIPDLGRLEAFANVVNNLGDSMAVTESEILNFVQRASALTGFGIDENELAAFGATMIELGLAPEVAARAFNTFGSVVANATKATPKAQAAFEDLGFSVEELQARMAAGEGTEVMTELFNAVAAEGPAALGIFTDIVGVGFADELTRIAGSAEGVGKGFQFMEESLAGGGSTLEQNAEIMGGTFNAEVKKLANAFDELKVKLTDTGFLDGIAGIVTGLTGLINRINDLHPAILGTITVIGALGAGLAAVVGGGLALLGALATAAGTVIQVFGAGGVLAFMTPTLLSIAAAIKAAAIAATSFAATFVGLFAALAAIPVVIFNIGAAAQGMTLTFQDFFNVIGNALMTLPQNLAALPAAIAVLIGQLVVSVTTGIAQMVAAVAMPITMMVANISMGITMMIARVSMGFAQMVAAISVAIAQMVVAMATGIAQMVARMVSGAAQMVSAIVSAGAQMVAAVSSLGAQFFAAGANIISSLVSGIRSKIGEAQAAIASVASTIRGALPFSPPKWGPLSDIMEAGPNIVGSIASGITPGPIAAAMRNALTPAQSQLSTTTGGGSTGGGGAISINFAPVINAGAGADVGAIREVLEQQVEQILQQIQQNQRRVSYG